MLEDRWQDQFLRQRNTGAVKIPKDPSGRADHSSSPSWAVFILKNGDCSSYTYGHGAELRILLEFASPGNQRPRVRV